MEDHRAKHRPAASSTPTGELCAAISNRIVWLHKKHYGIGPTKARTYYIDDVVLVVTRDGFSQVEQTLIRAGRGGAVLAQRAEVQEVVKGEFSDAIEELTGRRVIAFVSTNHLGPDLAAELFILEPSGPESQHGHGDDPGHSVFGP